MQDQSSNQEEALHTLKPLQKIGEYIRKAREEKNLSIEDLAGSLRIGKEQLAALENGDDELLPEEVFIKAMIRRIAERLQLEPSLLINEFNKNNISRIESEEIEIKKTNPINILKGIPFWALISGLIALIASGLAINYLRDTKTKQNKSDFNSPELAIQREQALKSGYHIVSKGQTLFMISKFHNIPLDKLMRINNLSNPNKLKVGTKLSLKLTQSNKSKSNILIQKK